MAVGTERLRGSRRLVIPEALGVLFLVLAVMAVLVYLWQGRETPVAKGEALSGSAVEHSQAFVRERGAPVSDAPEAIFGSGAYIRELAGIGSMALSPEAIRNSGAYIREAPGTAPTVLSAEAIQNSGAYLRELTAAEARASFGTWTQAREAIAPEVEGLSPQAIFDSGAHAREAGS